MVGGDARRRVGVYGERVLVIVVGGDWYDGVLL